GKDIAKKAAALSKKYEELGSLMYVYKPSRVYRSGGSNFGPSATDGLEARIHDLSKRPLSAAALKKQAKELIRIGQINLVIAQVASHYFTGPRDCKTRKDWDRHLDRLKKASRDFINAVKARDAKKLKAAAGNIDNACI